MTIEPLESRFLLSALTAKVFKPDVAKLVRGHSHPKSPPAVTSNASLQSSSASSPPIAGTWNVNSQIPGFDGAQLAILLSNGSVLVHGGGGGASSNYYELTPNAAGSYSQGTWTTVASSNLQRLFFGSSVLPNGDVFVVGGEYSNANNGRGGDDDNSSEIYDPVANTWTTTATFPQSKFGDDSTVVLPNGQVLAGYFNGPQTYIYNPSNNTWSAAGTKLYNDPSDEETWLKLSDGSILTYDIFSSISAGVGEAQRYIPSTNTWVATGSLPFLLSSAAQGYEGGPAVLLPDGRAWFTSPSGQTAFYTLSTNSWTAGPTIPDGNTLGDAPMAMLPNGDVLLSTSPPITGGPNHTVFPGPTTLYEFNPVTNTFTNVTPNNVNITLSGNSFKTTFLVLPNGQIMMCNDTYDVSFYTPVGTPDPTWAPVVSSIVSNGGGSYTLTGTQLNGPNEGASYGDDAQMASNYPLVRLISSSGTVYYARTSNWSLTGVATGSTPETVNFQLPAGLANGAYSLAVVANGISSTPEFFTVGANATVSGQVFQDNKSTGSFGGADVGLSGQTVYLDLNSDGVQDNGEPSTMTNGTGNYSFTNQPATETGIVRLVTGPSGFVAVPTTNALNLGYFPTTYNTTEGNDVYLLQLNSTGLKINISVGGVVTYIAPTTLVSSLLFNLGGGSNLLTVDLTNGNPIPGLGITYDGTGTDSLTVNAPAGNNAISVNGTTVLVNGLAITYAGLAALNITTGAGNDTLTQTAQPGNGATLNFSGGTGTDALLVSGGAFTIPADPTANGTASLAVSVGGGANPANIVLLGDANAVHGIDPYNLASVNIANNGTATLAAAASGLTADRTLLTTGSLVISGNGNLNITGNSVDVYYGSGSDPFSNVQTYVKGGAISSSLAGDGIHAVGYADGADRVVSGLASGDILIRYTVIGDVNLDGTVNFSDLLALSTNYGASNSRWDMGDFNNDGTVNFSDLLALAGNYGLSLA